MAVQVPTCDTAGCLHDGDMLHSLGRREELTDRREGSAMGGAGRE